MSTYKVIKSSKDLYAFNDSFVYKLGVSIRYSVTLHQVVSGNLLKFSSHSSRTKVYGSGKHSPVVRRVSKVIINQRGTID